jgi:DNA ligase 1
VTPDDPKGPSLPFGAIAATSANLASTRSRLQKKRFIVDLLAGMAAEEIPSAVGWLVEEPMCGPLGIGPAQLWELSRRPAPQVSSVSLREVESALTRASLARREEALREVGGLFERLSESERALFVGALTGSLRQGSLGGVMLQALAELSGKEEGEVRRAAMVAGSISGAARGLLGPAEGGSGPAAAVVLFRPLAPMLATPAASIEEALRGIDDALLEWKVDGVRAQVHKQGAKVALYSRHGNDITAGCASVVGALASLPVESAVLDGEVVLVGPDGAPRPFQESFSAIASEGVPFGDRLQLFVFDCLYRDGTDLLDEVLSARLDALRAVVPAELRMPNARGASGVDANAFYADALARGHEGVMVKDLASPYRLGARGRAWQKVKVSSTVDLVVLAAEWGSGRRKGFLSNLHLGARRDDGSFCMIGKTFKGLTDATLGWQTERLKALATERTGHAVHVRPELVVEIRFNEVQRSPRYPGGIALRFARLVRYREDKRASEAEPLAALVARLPQRPGDTIPPGPPGSPTGGGAAPGTPKRGKRGGGARMEGGVEGRAQLSLFDPCGSSDDE